MEPGVPPLTASQKQFLKKGIDLFNRGSFFECHEVLEEAWIEASGEPKIFLQGLIQVAAALHHLRRENLVGAVGLLRAGMKKLKAFAPEHEGVEVSTLLQTLQALIEKIASGEDSKGWPPPKIT